jgi:hypothetical protein
MSGKPITLATNSYGGIDPFDYTLSHTTHVYNGKNSYRLPAYHRADINLNSVKAVNRGIRTISFSIYNVYSRHNPYFVYYSKDQDNNEVKLYQLSLFPFLPSVSYSLKF